MQLTFTSNFWGKTYRSCQKNESLSLHDLSTGSHLLDVSFIASHKPKICTALNTQYTTKNSCFYVTRKKRRLQLSPNVCFTTIHRLLFTTKGRSASPSANNCQGQLKTSQSVSIPGAELPERAENLKIHFSSL